MTLSDLEAYVDRHGLARTLEDLSEICHLKHLETDWQDAEFAAAWANAANTIEATAELIKKEGI